MSGILPGKTEEKTVLHFQNPLDQDAGGDSSLSVATALADPPPYHQAGDALQSLSERAANSAGERARLEALSLYEVDSEPDEILDKLVKLAADICDSPVAAITFVGAERLFHKAAYGSVPLSTSREGSFFSGAILRPKTSTVADTRLDERIRNTADVTGASPVQSYAGHPLIPPEGYAIGTLSVMDFRRRDLSLSQLDSLKTLASSVMAHLN